VREGLCVPYPVPPNVDYVDRIRAAAEQARDGVGLYEPARSLLESPREYRQPGRASICGAVRPAGEQAVRPIPPEALNRTRFPWTPV
jgi:hypothetical protein